MVLYVYASNETHAVSDCYRQTIEYLENKKESIVIIPSVYEVNEFGNEYNTIIHEQFTKYRKLKYRIELIKLIKNLIIICKEKKVDKIIFFSTSTYVLYFKFLISMFKLDSYVFIHDPIAHTGERMKMKLIRKIADVLIINKTKGLIVTYKEGKEIVQKRYNKETKVIWLPEMKNMEFQQIKDSCQEEEYDCIFFGRIEKYKGIDVLLDSIKYIKENYNYKVKLLIAGKGPEADDIKNIINQNQLDVKFINKYVEDYELAKYIKVSKLVVLPYKDATGTQTIQIANYYNKPVIASGVGAFKEYIVNNTNGYVIDKLNAEGLGDTLFNYLTDKQKYNDLVVKIEPFFKEHFTIEKFTKEIEKFLSL